MPRQFEHWAKLSNGEQVGFNVKQRPGDPFWFVRFKDKTGRYLEKSTGWAKQKDAVQRAAEIVVGEYEATPKPEAISWDEAEAQLTTTFEANNFRPSSINVYLRTFRQVRQFWGTTRGPADIDAKLAKAWLDAYSTKPIPEGERHAGKRRSAYTVHSRLLILSAIWDEWLIGKLHVCHINPWHNLEAPKRDELDPKPVTDEQLAHFYAYLGARFNGWRLVRLFFDVKAETGCRLMDLCAAEAAHLQDGRLYFPPRNTKNRKPRGFPLPPAMYAELQQLAGPRYLWQQFPEQLRAVLTAKGLQCGNLKGFSPSGLYWWVERLLAEYNGQHPDREPLTTHAFCKRAMTRAWERDIDPRKAAIAYGRHIDTMMRYYVKLDAQAVTDEVAAALRGDDPAPTPEAPAILNPPTIPQLQPGENPSETLDRREAS